MAQENIRKRGRSYEQEIPDAYLYNLQEAYHSFIHQVDIPVMFIDKREIDFINNPERLESLLHAILREHPRGFHKIEV
jgi:deoxyadenosine/deoxycytidine kinase